MISRTVTHIGPDIDGIGGMETVLRTYRDLPWTSMQVTVLPSWQRGSVFRQLSIVTHTALALYRHKRSHGSSVVHVHVSHRGSFVREGALIWLASALRNQVFITVHGSQFVETSKTPLWRLIYRGVLSKATRIAVLNDQALDAVRQLRSDLPVAVLPNPGPVAVLPTELRRPHDVPLNVVFAGAVGRRKGVDVLIAAWDEVLAHFPNATLHLLGPLVDPDLAGPAAPYLRGPQPSAVVLNYLADARIAVLPSRAEGMPMFLLEAMGMGRPIIVSDIGAMPMLARDSGQVVPVGDSVALAKAILEYLRDGQLANDHGLVASKRYQADYGPKVVEQRIQAFYAGQ
jgi:glycosyltransferase involved in cell wall biosynthesis